MVRVVDGDTIIVKSGGHEYRVRYIGMDAPEAKSSKEAAQPLSAQATAANSTLVKGKTVVLEKDVSETDRFGRLLRHVWLNDGGTWTLVNAELVRRGVAKAKSYPPDVAHDDWYAPAQQEAEAAALGLWARNRPR